MDPFTSAIVSNVVVASLLAVAALAVSRLGRAPQLAHVLWMLVLIKLITPPVVQLSVPTFAGEHGGGISPRAQCAASEQHASMPLVDRSSPQPFSMEADADQVSTVEDLRERATAMPPDFDTPTEPEIDHPSATLVLPIAVADPAQSQPVFAAAASNPDLSTARAAWTQAAYAVWLFGALVYAGVLVRRWVQVQRLLADGTGADQELTDTAQRLADRLPLARCPSVRVVEARVPPLVWGLSWRPVIILPESLLGDLDGPQREAVLAHELAHVRRGDHLVRWLEIVALVPFWWNPLAWWARRELRRSEEECCDAWVVWLLPTCRRAYGRALLKTLEFLSAGTPAVAAASGFGKPFFKRRIEMILKCNTRPRMSWATWAAAGLTAIIVLPLGAQPEAAEDVADEVDAQSVAIAAAVDTVDELLAGEPTDITEDESRVGVGPVEEEMARAFEASERENTELARFRGRWKIVVVKHNGQPAPPEFEHHWRFDPDQSIVETTRMGRDAPESPEEMRRLRFAVNPDASPKELTIYGDNTLVQAIYKWEDDELVICYYGRSERERPRQFSNGTGTRWRRPSASPVMEFKLVKDASPAPGPRPASRTEQSGGADAVHRALQYLEFSEKLAQKGYVSEGELEAVRFAVNRAQESAEAAVLAREAQGQLLKLDVEEAAVKLQAAERLLETVGALRSRQSVSDIEVRQREHDVELARIALQRAEIKLKLHQQQTAVE